MSGNLALPTMLDIPIRLVRNILNALTPKWTECVVPETVLEFEPFRLGVGQFSQHHSTTIVLTSLNTRVMYLPTVSTYKKLTVLLLCYIV